jgi:hypothetical protein
MKFSILIFCLFIIQITTYGQNIIIKGSTIDYESQWMQPGTVIYIDSVSGTITDDSGQFILKRGELNHQDTLKVRFIGMYELNFINLPTDKDTITLDSIPLFEYFPGYSMADYFCKWYNFRCKRRWKKHLKAENLRVGKYINKQDSIIKAFIYNYDNNEYKIDLNTNCISLN